MRTLARYQEDGGWKCIIRGPDGEECRTGNLPYQDVFTHLTRDHGVKEPRLMEDTRHIEDWSDLLVEMLRAGGAI